MVKSSEDSPNSMESQAPPTSKRHQMQICTLWSWGNGHKAALDAHGMASSSPGQELTQAQGDLYTSLPTQPFYDLQLPRSPEETTLGQFSPMKTAVCPKGDTTAWRDASLMGHTSWGRNRNSIIPSIPLGSIHSPWCQLLALSTFHLQSCNYHLCYSLAVLHSPSSALLHVSSTRLPPCRRNYSH